MTVIRHGSSAWVCLAGLAPHVADSRRNTPNAGSRQRAGAELDRDELLSMVLEHLERQVAASAPAHFVELNRLTRPGSSWIPGDQTVSPVGQLSPNDRHLAPFGIRFDRRYSQHRRAPDECGPSRPDS